MENEHCLVFSTNAKKSTIWSGRYTFIPLLMFKMSENNFHSKKGTETAPLGHHPGERLPLAKREPFSP